MLPESASIVTLPLTSPSTNLPTGARLRLGVWLTDKHSAFAIRQDKLHQNERRLSIGETGRRLVLAYQQWAEGDAESEESES